MSTRAAIAMRLPDNTIHAIYCHNDGYPGWVGAVLSGWYKTAEQVKALIALGALSQLGPKLNPDPGIPHTFIAPQKDVTVAYHRDRKEPPQPAVTHKSVVSLMRDDWGIPYYYLFDERTGQWIPPTEG